MQSLLKADLALYDVKILSAVLGFEPMTWILAGRIGSLIYTFNPLGLLHGYTHWPHDI